MAKVFRQGNNKESLPIQLKIRHNDTRFTELCILRCYAAKPELCRGNGGRTNTVDIAPNTADQSKLYRARLDVIQLAMKLWFAPVCRPINYAFAATERDIRATNTAFG
ncbi:MAG: hypothetical protein LQ337_002118 [Flavoplaca oasis]|nr:MAG: hypothetical protein LQ337_002118 [Flavoplaca oasis]